MESEAPSPYPSLVLSVSWFPHVMNILYFIYLLIPWKDAGSFLCIWLHVFTAFFYLLQCDWFQMKWYFNICDFSLCELLIIPYVSHICLGSCFPSKINFNIGCMYCVIYSSAYWCHFTVYSIWDSIHCINILKILYNVRSISKKFKLVMHLSYCCCLYLFVQ